MITVGLASGELPQLQHGKVCVGWRKAVKYLKSLRGDKEEGLSESERADVVAYTAMCQGPLRDAVVRAKYVMPAPVHDMFTLYVARCSSYSTSGWTTSAMKARHGGCYEPRCSSRCRGLCPQPFASVMLCTWSMLAGQMRFQCVAPLPLAFHAHIS
jgi:Outer mitochondrial membrane transport complex protein